MYKQIFASSLVAIALIALSAALIPASPVHVAFAVEGTCGDKEVNQSWEECDGGPGCTSGCLYAFCGDGIVNQPAEQCDGTDGVTSGFKCTGGCILTPVSDAPFCGDGIVNQPAEQCDGGANCTSGCLLKEEDGNRGGGGGGGGSSSSGSSYPRLSVAQNGAIPRVRANSNTVGSLSIRNYGRVTAQNVEISITSLPAGFYYNGKTAVISTSTVWVITGDDFTSSTEGGWLYPRLWRIGNRPDGDMAIMNIPLTVGPKVKPGTYEIGVNALIGNAMAIDRNVPAKLKITVVAGTSPVVKTPAKTVAKAPVKKQIAAVAKPIVKPKATSTICIPTDEYAALMAASTTSAVTEPTNALAALGLLFDLGTGSSCFGLLVLLLIILAVIIAIRLIFHYMEAGTDGAPHNQMPLIK